MAPPVFPIPLTRLVRDVDTSFWNGNGHVHLAAEDIVAAIERDPDVTVAALRERLRREGKPEMIRAGLDFEAKVSDQFRLGEPRGASKGMSIGFDVNAGVDAWVYIILSEAGLKSLQAEHPADLRRLLRDHTVLTGQNALVVLSMGGGAGVGFASTVLEKPGLKVGVSFKAGGRVDYVCCVPAESDQVLLEVVKGAFSRARLPQTSLAAAKASGHQIALRRNEMLYTGFSGFLRFGAQATLGYRFTGTKGYQLGHLDLATKLQVQTRARVDAAYSLAGAFRIIVLPGARDGWLRVVVDKDSTRTFEFAVAATAEVSLSTKGLPSKEAGALALVESVLGVTTPQVVKQTLELAQLSPEELRTRADGFFQGLVEKWVGKAFDKALAEVDVLRRALDEAHRAASILDTLDDQAVGLYERFLDAVDYDDVIGALDEILSKGTVGEQSLALMKKFGKGPAEVREFVEALAGHPLGRLVVRFDALRDVLGGRLGKFRTLVEGEAKGLIKKFVRSKLDTLGLTPLFAELAKWTTPAQLKAQASRPVKALVERLTGKLFDELMSHPEAVATVKEINRLAKGFVGTLERVNDYVRRALNAKGRADVSYAYQRVREGEKLLDVEINIEAGTAALRSRAFELYERAVSGDFLDVLEESNPDLVRVSSARFTDLLEESGTLKVHVFGWDYREVASVLSNLEASVSVSPTGTMTLFKLRVEGERLTESRRRATALNYLLQVAGTARGAIGATSELRRRAVDAMATLRSVESELRYQVKDKLTSLDELTTYLDLGEQLSLFGPGQRAGLVETLAALRRDEGGGASMQDADFGRVEVTYTVSFDGEALAQALAHDLAGETITWWNDDLTPLRQPARDHRQALEALYVDRLIASQVLGRRNDASDYALAALYRAGMHAWVKANPAADPARWPGGSTLTLRRGDGTTSRVFVPGTELHWARRHYFVNVRIAELLDRFRLALAGGPTISVGDLEEFFRDLVKRLLEIGQGPQSSLPFMLLDELVRRANPGSTEARRAMLEVALIQKDGDKPLTYIPISG